MGTHGHGIIKIVSRQSFYTSVYFSTNAV